MSRNWCLRCALLSSSMLLAAEGATHAADIVNNSTLTYANSTTVSDNIVGTGSVIVGSVASVSYTTVIFTGTNTYTGGTRFDSLHGATLQLGNGGTTGSIVGDVTDASPYDMLIFDRSDTYIFAGNISGGGGQVGGGNGAQIGSGTLILTGNSKFYLHGGFSVAAGSTLQVGNGGTVGSLTAGGLSGGVTNSGTLVFDRSDTYTFQSRLFGTGSIVQLGTGTTIIDYSNSGGDFSGPITVMNGTLKARVPSTAAVQSGATLWTNVLSSAATVTVAPGGTLQLATNYGPFGAGSVYNSGTVVLLGDFNGSIVGSGAITMGNGIVTTYGANISAGGGLNVSSGKLWLARTTTVTGGINVSNGGTLFLTDSATYSGRLSVANGGTVVVRDNITPYDASTITLGPGGTLEIGDLQPGLLTGNLVDNGTLAFGTGGTYTFAGDISGSGGVLQMGLGTTILTGNLTYTGPTVVTAGNLILGGSSGSVVIPSGSGVVTVGNGGTTGSLPPGALNFSGTIRFNRSDTYVYAGTLSGGGSVEQTGTGTIVFAGNNTYTGLTTVSAGTLQIGNGGTTGSIAGNVINNGTVIFDRSDTLTYAGQISGNGALQQMGSGILILSGLNPFSGATTVSAGTLTVNGGLAGSINTASNATLKGTGTIGGAVNNAGIVAPGNSIGTLTVGSFTQTSSGALQIEVSPSASDLLTVSGPASLAGALNLQFGPGSYGRHRYTILSAGSVTGTFTNISTTGGMTDVAYGVGYSSTTVTLVTVPKSDAQVYGDFATNSFEIADTFNDLVFGHLASAYCGPEETSQGRAKETECTEAAVWLEPIGGVGARDAGNGADGYSTRWAGLIGGIDVHLDTGLSLGAALTYTRNVLNIASGGGRLTTDSFGIAMSGGMPVFDGRVDVNGLWMTNNAQTRHNSGTASISSSANPKGAAYEASAQYSQPVIMEDLAVLVRLTYASVDLDATQESGATPSDFTVKAKTGSSFYGDLGLRLSHIYTLKSGTMVVPELRAGVRGYFESESLAPTVALVSGSSFTSPAPDRDRAAFIAGVGVTAQRSQGLALYLRGEMRGNGSEREAAVAFGGSLRF